MAESSGHGAGSVERSSLHPAEDSRGCRETQVASALARASAPYFPHAATPFSAPNLLHSGAEWTSPKYICGRCPPSQDSFSLLWDAANHKGRKCFPFRLQA